MFARLSRLRARAADYFRGRLADRRRGVQVARSARIGPKVSVVARGSGRVAIGAGVQIGANTSITAEDGASVSIGRDVFISGLCIIAARERIDIGDETMIAEMVCIRDHDHDPSSPPRTGRMISEPVSIGARVWIGSKASVVRGGSAGDDSVIGAHGLVNRTVPPRQLAVGVPARVRRSVHPRVVPRSET